MAPTSKLTRTEAMRRAREMYGDGTNGWTMRAIHRYLHARGVQCSYVTVLRWCRTDLYEQHLAHNRGAKRLQRRTGTKPRQRKRYVMVSVPPRECDEPSTPIIQRPAWTHTSDGRLARMRALADAGLSNPGIAIVMAVDLGDPEPLGRAVIGRALATGQPPREWRPPGRVRLARMNSEPAAVAA